MSCLSMSIKFWTWKLSWLHSKLVGEWIFLWASRNLNPLAHMASAFFFFFSLVRPAATWWCISGTDLLGQVYVLPHWDRSYRSNFLPHPLTVSWHRAGQFQRWPYNARRLAGIATGVQTLKSLVWLDPDNPHSKSGNRIRVCRSRGWTP